MKPSALWADPVSGPEAIPTNTSGVHMNPEEKEVRSW
jgi:hypothetical protein